MSEENGNRRDFLYVATAGTGAVIGGAAVWPMINQMNPSADVQALSSIEVDVSGVEPGTQITVKWRGKPFLYVVVQQKRSQMRAQLRWLICLTWMHGT